jgi:nucleotide-binding universal stress UspA family protein
LDGPIVVGTDGSDTATNAVSEAILLASAMGRALHIVSAYKSRAAQVGSVPTEFHGSLTSLGHVESVLADVADRARSRGVNAQTHARDGDPATVLLELAEELDASLLVVGNKGIGSAKRFVLGNVPSKVVHHSPCSTYVVHTG